VDPGHGQRLGQRQDAGLPGRRRRARRRGRDAGLEAITWVPDELLVAKGFIDESKGARYNPADYAGHGTGLFFAGVEQDGRIIAYALNRSTGTFSRVATIASGFPKVMELTYEPETTHLWAVCDDGCDGRTATLDIAQSGPNSGRFAVTNVYERPAGMPNLNNEGFAIAPRAECVNGLKPVFWADDLNTGDHALRSGAIKCTPLPAPQLTVALKLAKARRTGKARPRPGPRGARRPHDHRLDPQERSDPHDRQDDAHRRRRGQADVHAEPEAQRSRPCAATRRSR
jgi:hypothetical protein